MTLDEYKAKKEEILRINTTTTSIPGNKYTNYEKCAHCKGKNCCQYSPCGFSPEEFLDINNKSYILKLLKTGLIVISQLSKDDHIHYIRVRGKRDQHRIVTGFKKSDNACILLSKNGCLLDPTFRPTVGLLTIPYTLSCTEHYGLKPVKRDWSKYQGAIDELIEECGATNITIGKVTSQDVENYQKSFLSL